MKRKFFGLFFSFFALITIAYLTPVYSYTLDDATALYNMGIDYYSQNQVQKSMDYFKRAISIDPKFYEAYYNLAQIQASYGYTDAAIKSYEKDKLTNRKFELVELMEKETDEIKKKSLGQELTNVIIQIAKLNKVQGLNFRKE